LLKLRVGEPQGYESKRGTTKEVEEKGRERRKRGEKKE
jgi:hypothetical protein